MSKTIRESLGPVHERNAATIIDEATPQFEVKYSSSKRGPIKVTKFMTQDEAQAFLKKIRGEGMNGIVSKGGKVVRTPMKEDAKSERLAKIARAAAAREKDQAKQKEAAKQKHYAASAKSRESVKHFKDKRSPEEKEAASKARYRYNRSKNTVTVNDIFRTATGGKGKVGKKLALARLNKEEVEQIDEISVKKKAQAYRKMRDRQADVSYNPHTGKSDMLADTPEKKRANRMLKRIGDKHGKDVKRAVYKSQYEEVEQTDESLRQRADDAMTFSNRQAAFSTAFKKKHGRAPTKQELRDAGVGKGGDNPAGAKAYQKAMSKLRPASRSGIKDKFVHSEEVEIDEGRRRVIDDEGYRRDSRGREYNPVDDRIRARNAARHRAEAEAKRKKAEAERKKKEKTNESVGITEDDKAEYNKLMDKYGDMPMSKVPMKARLRIRELGRSVRGDKGGPTAGDLVKSMKRRRMGEEVEQVGEAVDGWIAMYNGKKVEIKKSEAKDLYAAKLKAIQMLKVPKSKQGLLAIKPAVNEEVEQVAEAKKGAIASAARKGMPPYTIVAIQGLNPPKVVAQETTMIASAVPAHVKEMKSKYPKAKISVEGKSGKILHTEQVAEGGMIGRTKPSRELNVQKFEKKYLGTKSLKDAKRAAHKAERKKAKQDIKKGD